MSWISLLTLFGPLLADPAALPCPTAVPPSNGAACSCAPCCCKEKCKCPTCKCDSCPAPRATVGCTVGSATPTSCTPAGKLYEVQVKLNDQPGCAGHDCLSPKVVVVEGGHALVSMNGCAVDSKPTWRLMHVHLGKASGDCVPVELTVASGGCGGTRLHAQQTVHFDTVTGMVLSGKQPEPACAQVTVCPFKSPRSVSQPEPCITLPAPPMAVGPMTCPARCQPVARWNMAQTPMPPPCPLPPPTPVSTHFPAPVPCWTIMPEPMPMPIPMTIPRHPPMPVTALPPQGGPTMVSLLQVPALCAECRGTHVRLVHEAGKARLKMKTMDGTISTAVHLKVAANEVGSLQLAAGKQHVHVSGKQWKATADHVEMYPDGRVILTGHVKMISSKVGVCSSLKADRVCLAIKHGKVETVLGGVFK